MGVTAQITEGLLGPVEGPFGVHDPFLASEFSDEPLEGWRVLEVLRG